MPEDIKTDDIPVINETEPVEVVEQKAEQINMEQLQMCFNNIPGDHGLIIYELAMTRYRLAQQMQINQMLKEKQ